MTEPDILAELAAIMHKDGPLSDAHKRAVQRARNEIAALRWMLTQWDGHKVDLEPEMMPRDGVA